MSNVVQLFHLRPGLKYETPHAHKGLKQNQTQEKSEKNPFSFGTG